MVDPASLPWVFAVFAVGGGVKGMLGFGMPLTTMSLLSAFLDVPTAAALNVLPMLCANLFQANRSGLFATSVRRFWPMLIALAIGTWIGATLVVTLDTRWLLGTLGTIVVLFSAIQFLHPHLRLPDRFERLVGTATGLVAGIIGGLTTVHGPPLIMYATALHLTKEAFVAALGTFFLLGGAFVMIAFVERGVLNYETAPWSAACVVPVLAGMAVGNRLSHRVDRKRFRAIVVFALFILGINLLRRAVI